MCMLCACVRTRTNRRKVSIIIQENEIIMGLIAQMQYFWTEWHTFIDEQSLFVIF